MFDALHRIANLRTGILLLCVVGAACAPERTSSQRSLLQGASPAPTLSLDPRATAYALNETEMAYLSATNIVRLTQRAPFLPTYLPDPTVVRDEDPQRLAGNGVIIQNQFMGRGPLSHTNEWVGYVDRTIVEVVAGAKYTLGGAASDEGELIVAHFDVVTGERLDVQEYFAQGHTGALSILDVEASRLILTTTHQQVLEFDLSTKSFVLVDEPYRRSVSMSQGTLEVASNNSSATGERELLWTMRLLDDPAETVVTLTTREGDGDWTLSLSDETHRSLSTGDAESLASIPEASTIRVFDVRGRTILFVSGRKLVWAFDVVTGQWSAEMALSGQPDLLATRVPVYDALLETSYGPIRDQTPTSVENELPTTVP